MKRSILFVMAVCVMAAGLSQAADVRYKSSGDYFDTTNSTGDVNGWQWPTVPGSNETIRLNWGGAVGNFVTLTNAAAPDVAAFQFGVNESGTLTVGDGGSLTALGNSKVGNNANCTGTLIINSNGYVAANGAWLMVAGSSTVKGVVTLDGGELDIAGHLWCATGSGSDAQVTINSGTLSVGQMIGLGTVNPGDLGANGGIAKVNVNGGVLELSNIHSGINNNPITGNSIRDGSALNVALTGKVTIPGDFMTTFSNYVARGSILGYSKTNNVNIELEIPVPGTTNTVITAKNAAVPDLKGLDLTSVTNTLTLFGFTVGDVLTNYVVGTTPERVISQNPASGSEELPGTPIDVTIMEPLAETETTVDVAAPGNWMNPVSWNIGTVPERETQNFKVRSFNGDTTTVTNEVACKWLVWGDGATGAQLDIEDGGHLHAGFFTPGWSAIGYSTPTTLNVYTGGVFEAHNRVLFGWGAGGAVIPGTNCFMNIDGGTVLIDGWLGLGRGTPGVFATANVLNGGKLSFERFNYSDDCTNGVINLYDGIVELDGNRSNDVVTAMNQGLIAVAPGYSYKLDQGVTTAGKTTLFGFQLGYAGWASTWGVDIGSEEEDYDNDLAKNVYEYGTDGDPTDDQDTGEAPVLVNNGGVLEYSHLSRADDTNLVYTVVTTTDLTGGSWTPVGSSVLSTNVTGGDYNVVTNVISTDVDERFIRLQITNP